MFRVLMVVVMLFTLGCEVEDVEPEEEPEPVEAVEEEPAEEEPVGPECVDATQAGEAIAEGIEAEGGGELTGVVALEGDGRWFLAGLLTVPGVENVGVWAVDDPELPTRAFSANAHAEAFTEWPREYYDDPAADEILDCF